MEATKKGRVVTGKSKDYFSGRADAVDDAVRLLNNHAAMFTSQTSCVIAALAKRVETLKEGDDMALYRWLEQAAKSDYKEVYEAARTMMAYYQGAEFQTKDQESLAAQPDADGLPSVPSEIINAISHYGDERDGGTNSAQAFGDVVRLIRVELSRAQTAPAVDLASVSDELSRVYQQSDAFEEYWKAKQECPEHNLITKNAAHATWHEACDWMRTLLSRPSAPAPVSEQPAFPERDPSKPAEQQGMFRKFDVRRVDGSDQPGGKHHGCRYFVLDLDHDPAAPAGMRGYAAEIRATHPKLADDIEAEFGEQPAAQTFCASCHTVVRCAESGECDHHGYKLQIAEGGGNE